MVLNTNCTSKWFKVQVCGTKKQVVWLEVHVVQVCGTKRKLYKHVSSACLTSASNFKLQDQFVNLIWVQLAVLSLSSCNWYTK